MPRNQDRGPQRTQSGHPFYGNEWANPGGYSRDVPRDDRDDRARRSDWRRDVSRDRTDDESGRFAAGPRGYDRDDYERGPANPRERPDHEMDDDNRFSQDHDDRAGRSWRGIVSSRRDEPGRFTNDEVDDEDELQRRGIYRASAIDEDAPRMGRSSRGDGLRNPSMRTRDDRDLAPRSRDDRSFGGLQDPRSSPREDDRWRWARPGEPRDPRGAPSRDRWRFSGEQERGGWRDDRSREDVGWREDIGRREDVAWREVGGPREDVPWREDRGRREPMGPRADRGRDDARRSRVEGGPFHPSEPRPRMGDRDPRWRGDEARSYRDGPRRPAVARSADDPDGGGGAGYEDRDRAHRWFATERQPYEDRSRDDGPDRRSMTSRGLPEARVGLRDAEEGEPRAPWSIGRVPSHRS